MYPEVLHSYTLPLPNISHLEIISLSSRAQETFSATQKDEEINC